MTQAPISPDLLEQVALRRYDLALDKNSWMKTAYIMSGFERSQQSRELNNNDRSHKIQSLKKPKDYDSKLTYKPNSNMGQTYHTIEDIMSQKARIRSRRNQEAKRQLPFSQRKLSEADTSVVEMESLKSKMAQTTRQLLPIHSSVFFYSF